MARARWKGLEITDILSFIFLRLQQIRCEAVVGPPLLDAFLSSANEKGVYLVSFSCVSFSPFRVVRATAGEW